MRIKEGFELREVCGEHIIMAHGDKNIDFSKVISLNESATVMWNAVVGKDFCTEELVTALLDVYDAEEDKVREDVTRAVHEWKEIGLIE